MYKTKKTICVILIIVFIFSLSPIMGMAEPENILIETSQEPRLNDNFNSTVTAKPESYEKIIEDDKYSGLSETSNNQNSISTINILVVDRNGYPIQNAELSIGEYCSVTGEDGIAKFEVVDSQVEYVTVNADGYKSKTTAINIKCIYNYIFTVSMDIESEKQLFADNETSERNISQYIENDQVYVDSEISDFAIHPNSPSIEQDGKIYCFGDKTMIYDIENNSWSYGTSIPCGGIKNSAIVENDGYIYIIGGVVDSDSRYENPNDETRNSLYIYYPYQDGWSMGDDIPHDRSYFNANCIDGKIYCFGGLAYGDPDYAVNNEGAGVADPCLDIYDIKTGEWNSNKNFNFDGYGFTSVVYNGMIYITGEYGFDINDTDKLLVYNPVTNKFTNMQERPASSDTYGCGGGNLLNFGSFFIYQGGASPLVYGDDEYERVTDSRSVMYIPDKDEWYYCDFGFSENGGLFNYVIEYNGSSYLFDGDRFKISNFISFENDVECISNEVSVGDGYAAFITKSKKLTVIGDNSFGQFGVGSRQGEERFTEISLGNLDGKLRSVVIGGKTTYLITDDNCLYACGLNDCGQIGDGTTENKEIRVIIMQNVAAVAAGEKHVLALDTKGGLWVWGSQENGRLGNSQSSGVQSSPLKLMTMVRSIAAGKYSSYYTRLDRSLYSFGKNEFGQLGLSDTVDRSIPEFVMADVYKIEAGYNHAEALCENGSVFTWGDNSRGQLGRKSDLTYSAIPVNIENVTASAIFAGGWESVYCVNSVLYKCGAYQDNSSFSLMDLENVNQISLGIISLAKDIDGNIWGWGHSNFENNLYNLKTSVPQKISFDYDFKEVDSYRLQTIAIDDCGKVYSWGTGYFADGSDKEASHGSPIIIDNIDNAVKVVRGKNHNLVLNDFGQVYGWGSNTNYPMGNIGGKIRTAQELKITSNVKDIAAGAEFSIFLQRDGSLRGVGKNDKGQLGQGNTATSNELVRITDKNDFKMVDAGEDFAAALASDGLYVWGSNEYGQLGVGNNENVLIPQKLEITGEIITDISCGTNYCLALTSTGNVYSWGRNGSGQLGLGNKININIPTRVNTLSNIKKVFSMYTQSFAVSADGKVYGWGYGKDDALGYEHDGTVQSPIEIKALSDKNISKLVGGNGFSIAMDNSGQLYSFGKNDDKALGIIVESPKLCAGSKYNDMKWLDDYMSQYDNGVSSDIVLPEKTQSDRQLQWHCQSYYLNDSGKVIRPSGNEGDKLAVLSVELSENKSDNYNNCKMEKRYPILIKSDSQYEESVDNAPERIKANSAAMNGAGFTNKPNYTPPDEPNEESVSLADLHTHSDSLIPDILISENKPLTKRETNVFSLNDGDKVTSIRTTPSRVLYNTSICRKYNDDLYKWFGWSFNDSLFYRNKVSVSNYVAGKNETVALENVNYIDDYDYSRTGNSIHKIFRTCHPDEYEPNQCEFEIGLMNRNDQRIYRFNQNVGGYEQQTEAINDLNFDSFIDIDAYPVEVSAGDKLTVSIEIEGSLEIAQEYTTALMYDYTIGDEIDIDGDLSYTNTCTMVNIQNDIYQTGYNKFTKFLTWIMPSTGLCYINVGRTDIGKIVNDDIEIGSRINYSMNVSKVNDTVRDNELDEEQFLSNPWLVGIQYVSFMITNDYRTINGMNAPKFGGYDGASYTNGTIDNQLDVDWTTYVSDRSERKKIQTNGYASAALFADGELKKIGKSFDYDFAQGHTYYIGAYCPDGEYQRMIDKNMRDYQITLSPSGQFENEKTVYIMLYDSIMYGFDSSPSRYRNDSGSGSYQYSKEFFKKYYELIGDKKAAFVISVRDLDFDLNPAGYQRSKKVYMKDLNQMRLESIQELTVARYEQIINYMKEAAQEYYGSENQMPEVYIGTPHTYHYDVEDKDLGGTLDTKKKAQDFFLNKYKEMARNIYYNLTSSVGEECIDGIYYGREDPDERYDVDGNATISYQNMSNISDMVHGWGKKLLWVPYCTDDNDWQKIGSYVNTGKSCNNGISDLFDVVLVQPGLYFSDYKLGDQIPNRVVNLRNSSRDNIMYYGNSVIDNKKNTDTTISFELEYDISLVSGRIHGEYKNRVSPKMKSDTFAFTYNYYKDFIRDNATSYGIYCGGPNEQSYNELFYGAAANNQNRHNVLNHPSYFGVYYIYENNDYTSNDIWSEDFDGDGIGESDGSDRKYYEFYNMIGDNEYYYEYTNELIFDITNGVINNNWSYSALQYLNNQII